MKKLMIAAAVAAMGAGVYAAGIPATGEEAYDFTATLKTTKGKLATAKAKSNACLYEGKAFFRTQATVKLQGLIWGCWCQTIGAPTAYTAPDADGYVFWNVTDKAAYNDFASTAFNWTVLNRIESTAKKVEGLWTLDLFYLDADDNSVQEFALVGAGFGTAAGNLYNEDFDETTYISSISGQAVGQRFYTCVGDEVELGSFCKMGGETPYEFIWWELCDCADSSLDTVAYGSWSIKWNGKVAAAMAKYANILEAYKFPKYVAEAMTVPPAPTPDDCDMAKQRVEDINREINLLKQGKIDADALLESTLKARDEYSTANAAAAFASNLVYAAAFTRYPALGGIPGVETNEFGEIVGSTELVTATKAKNDADAALAELQALKAQGADMTLKYESDSLVKKFFEYEGKDADATRQQALDALIPLCAADGLYANNIVDATAKFGRPNAALAFVKEYNAKYDELSKAYNDAEKAADEINKTYDEDLVKLNAKLGTAEAQRDALCD